MGYATKWGFVHQDQQPLPSKLILQVVTVRFDDFRGHF